MIEKTALDPDPTVSHKLGPTKNQAKGEALSNASSPKNLSHESHSPDLIIGHRTRRDLTKHRVYSVLPPTSHPCPRSSRESIPIGHATPQRLSPTHF
jgi:hypothetical protein